MKQNYLIGGGGVIPLFFQSQEINHDKRLKLVWKVFVWLPKQPINRGNVSLTATVTTIL